MTINLQEAKQDLYQAVNGEWLKTAVIPDDKPSTGGFMDLNEGIEKLAMKDMAEMAQGNISLTKPEEEEMIKLYRLAMDFERLDQEGGQPVQSDLAQIQALEKFLDLQEFAKEWLLNGNPFAFSFENGADMKNTEKYALYLSRPGLILPDKTYYEAENEQGPQLLAIWKEMAQQVLVKFDIEEEEAHTLVQKAVDFDAAMVPYVKSNEELADYTKAYNPRKMQDVKAYHDHFDLQKLIEDLIGQEVPQVIVTEPGYFENLAIFFNEEHFEAFKAWLIVSTALNACSLLSEDLRQTGSLYSLALSGNPQTMDREKHAFYVALNTFSQVFGCYYGKKYFGEKAREDVAQMVQEMIGVYKERLSKNTWLSKETIAKACVKLDAIQVMVGYPDDYPEVYSQLKVKESESLYLNVQRFSRLCLMDNLKKWNQEVDHNLWQMSGHTVNAYYDPFGNKICFPAGILQAPFYSLKQTRSQNYGGIGGVIAHEISHAFDNNGAQFDEKGNLNNWWKPEDFEIFKEKSQAMIDQFEGLPLGEDGQVNGTLTVSENIADAGGLQTAYQAMTHEESYDPEAFFNNWAKIWCMKARPQYQALLLAIDVHAPNYWRANQQVKNLAAFHETYGTQEGDGMYLAPEARVVIW